MIAASPAGGQTIDWYDAPDGENLLLSGNTFFTTPSISITTLYYATARNVALGCVSATRTTVTAMVNSVPMESSGGTTNPTCFGGTSGTTSITLSASTSGTYTVDGGSPVSYSSNPFTVSGLSAGLHTIIATSAAGCESSNIVVTVGGSASFSASYVKTNMSACNAVNDGTITVTAVGGYGPYTYSIDGNTYQPGTIFTGVDAGTYTGYSGQ